MFKLISCLVAGSIVLAPLLPAQAGYENRSSGFGVSISSPSGFGSFGRQPYGDGSGYGRNRVILRSTVGNRVGNPYNSSPYNSSPYSTYPYGAYSPGIYSPGFRRSTVIVAPNVRTVILNPGYNNSRNDNYRNDRYQNDRYQNGRSNCGSVIYGSPIVSPVPVNPYTGLACR